MGTVSVALAAAAWFVAFPDTGPGPASYPAGSPPAVEPDVGPGEPAVATARTRLHVDVLQPPTTRRPGVSEWDHAVRLHRAGRSEEALALLRAARRERPEAFTASTLVALLAEMELAVVDRFEETTRSGWDRKASLRLAALQTLVLGDDGRARLAALAAGHVREREAALLVAADADEQAILARHLRRFGFGLAESDGSGSWVDGGLRRMVAGRAVPRVPRKPLPDADLAESERRRVEQLEKLREREAVQVLDPIHAGLAWLALHQSADGSFSDPVTRARCKELAHGDCLADEKDVSRPLAATALAVLAFLDFRDQDAHRVFEPNLAAGVRWLQARVKADGSLGLYGYDAGIALLALGQATSASGEPGLREIVERAWAHAAARCGPNGGFRYSPGQAGDLSITGWYVQAYEAARDAEVPVPDSLAPGLLQFTRTTWRGGHTFSYLPGQQVHASLESAGMLCLVILGAGDDEALRRSWMERLEAVPEQKVLDLYRLYYDVRMDLLLRGAAVPVRRAALLEFADNWQVREGPATGRFQTAPEVAVTGGEESGKKVKTTRPRELRVSPGGPTVFTAFSVLTLEHALYRR